MNILVVNDDSWNAKGIHELVKLMQQIGNVTVIAPETPQSGKSNAITVMQPITLRLVEKAENLAVYTTSGTPSDCIKLALEVVLKDQPVDLVVSGINHGSNAAVNVIYSGTMGACFVAAEHDIPAIGFSLNDHHSNADFSQMEPYILPLTEKLLQHPFPHGVCYNINAPLGEIHGVRFTRQCQGHWEKELKPYQYPNGETFYILTGNFVNHEPDAEDTDEWAMAHGYISVTPCALDTTCHQQLQNAALRTAVENNTL